MFSLIAPSERNIVLPPDAGPGQARIVIGPDLPPPLDTYIPSGSFPTATGLAGGFIFYSEGDDTTYVYFVDVEDDAAQQVAGAIIGFVVNGSVVERTGSPGVPMGIVLDANNGVTQPVITLTADILDVFATNGIQLAAGPTGAVSISAAGATANVLANTGGVQITASAAGQDVDIAATDDVTASAGDAMSLSAGNSLGLSGGGTSTITLSATGITVGAAGAGDDITLTATDVATLAGATATLSGGGSTVTADAAGVAIAAPGGGDDITLTAAGDVTLSSTSAANTITMNTNGIAIAVAGAGDDITLTSPDDVIIDAADTIVSGSLHWRTGTAGADATTVDGTNFTASPSTTSATYVFPAAAGDRCSVVFVAPPGGKVIVLFAAGLDHNTAGSTAWVAPEVRAGTTPGTGTVALTASDNYGISSQGTDEDQHGRHAYVSGLTPGSSYNAFLTQRTAGAGTAFMARQEITVMPVL